MKTNKCYYIYVNAKNKKEAANLFKAVNCRAVKLHFPVGKNTLCWISPIFYKRGTAVSKSLVLI